MSFNANDRRYKIDADSGYDMSAVERSVHFAHALQHDDPLAHPARVSRTSNGLAQSRSRCEQTHARNEFASHLWGHERPPDGIAPKLPDSRVSARERGARAIQETRSCGGSTGTSTPCRTGRRWWSLGASG